MKHKTVVYNIYSLSIYNKIVDHIVISYQNLCLQSLLILSFKASFSGNGFDQITSAPASTSVEVAVITLFVNVIINEFLLDG